MDRGEQAVNRNADHRAARFIVITSAYNEANKLPRVLESMLAQTERPLRWFIVSDGSTDGTDAIAADADRRHGWITFIRRERDRSPDSASRVSPGKVAAVREALRRTSLLDYDFLAILDADVSFSADYYESVLRLFDADQRVGMAGGAAYNVFRDGTVSDTGFTNPSFVGGPVQMFRRGCYEQIGGYVPYGHEDVIAVAMAKMLGWRVHCDPSIRALHWGQEASGSWEKIPILFKMGRTDYIMRGSLWFEILRGVRRMSAPPYLLAGLSQIAGYLTALVSSTGKIPASRALRRYLLSEELSKIRSGPGRGLAGSKGHPGDAEPAQARSAP